MLPIKNNTCTWKMKNNKISMHKKKWGTNLQSALILHLLLRSSSDFLWIYLGLRTDNKIQGCCFWPGSMLPGGSLARFWAPVQIRNYFFSNAGKKEIKPQIPLMQQKLKTSMRCVWVNYKKWESNNIHLLWKLIKIILSRFQPRRFAHRPWTASTSSKKKN